MTKGAAWRASFALASVLLGWTAFAQVGRAQDDWTVRPRANVIERLSVLPDSTALIKSLSDAAELLIPWRPPADAAGWKTRRPEVERAFRASIGLVRLPERTPLNARITARLDRGDYTIENVIFESRPGFPVTANLYRPKGAAQGKRPAILCPVGHHLSAGKTAAVAQERSIGLVRMGFVVLAYDPIGQGERMVAGNIHHDAGYALLPLGETIAGWMVWDSMRAIDYLLTLPEVDPMRIGITGNSGGGLNTLYTAALDPRVSAAAVAGYTYEFRNWIKYAGSHCTCTHLSGVFRGMEWFEIAGLIAPRPLMMLQGEHDAIFPIEGARRAARDTAAIYRVLGHPGRVSLEELPGQRHAYSQPFREPMYGFMARWLLDRGSGGPIPEGVIEALPEEDPRLLCDPERAVLPRAPTVTQLARERGLRAVAALDRAAGTEAAARWVRDLTAPPEDRPHFLSPETPRRSAIRGRTLEKISFVSEEGQYIPGLLWLPEAAPRRTVIAVDSRGKGAIAESGLVEPLIENGFAVLSVDLRGRGETLGRHRGEWNTNFRLVLSQVLSGRPLAGRRAFDLTRAIDYLSGRGLPLEGLAVAAFEDEALSALLAAAADGRIRKLVLSSYIHSFVSQMRHRAAGELPRQWNDPQVRGRIDTGDYEIDFGSVVPDALRHADVADIAGLVAPRRLLFCQARDNGVVEETLRARLSRALPPGGYLPDRALNSKLLIDWLQAEVKP